MLLLKKGIIKFDCLWVYNGSFNSKTDSTSEPE